MINIDTNTMYMPNPYDNGDFGLSLYKKYIRDSRNELDNNNLT